MHLLNTWSLQVVFLFLFFVRWDSCLIGCACSFYTWPHSFVYTKFCPLYITEFTSVTDLISECIVILDELLLKGQINFLDILLSLYQKDLFLTLLLCPCFLESVAGTGTNPAVRRAVARRSLSLSTLPQQSHC